LKRSLPIVEGSLDPRPPEPIVVHLGGSRVIVSDGHDGAQARGFANLLLDQGGTEEKPEHAEPTVTVVVAIRSGETSRESRLRAEALEESADFVLGSSRPAFARLLAERVRR